MLRCAVKWTPGALLIAGLMALTGCTGFFVPVNNGGGSGGGGTTTNQAYVINAQASTVTGFSIGATGTLTSLSTMPFNLAFVPQAAVVSMGNNFLYVAGPGAVYVFSIAANGALTQVGTALGNEISLDVSPDGNWLFGLNGLTTTLDVFQINTTTGMLSAPSATPYPTAAQVVFIPKMVKVSANGALIFAAAGNNGDLVFSFNTLTGAVVLQQTLAVSATTSDNGLAVDKNSAYLYIARSGTGAGLAVYTIGANGLLTSVNGSPFAAGAQPLAVVLDSTGKYAYVANGSDGNISGYALNSGVATKLGTSPFVSGATVNSLAVDSSGKYLLASAFGGSPDLTMYSYDASTAGQLDKVATGSTGSTTGGALEVVVTH